MKNYIETYTREPWDEMYFNIKDAPKTKKEGWLQLSETTVVRTRRITGPKYHAKFEYDETEEELFEAAYLYILRTGQTARGYNNHELIFDVVEGRETTYRVNLFTRNPEIWTPPHTALQRGLVSQFRNRYQIARWLSVSRQALDYGKVFHKHYLWMTACEIIGIPVYGEVTRPHLQLNEIDMESHKIDEVKTTGNNEVRKDKNNGQKVNKTV